MATIQQDAAKGSSIDTRLGITAIAFWQFAAFVILILLIWANGILDLPYLMFGSREGGLDIFECSILTCAVIFTAVVTVGHTYLRQRKIAASLVTVCSACHKVRVSHEAWSAVEDYVSEHSDITFSHGLCPECFATSIKDITRPTECTREPPRPSSSSETL